MGKQKQDHCESMTSIVYVESPIPAQLHRESLFCFFFFFGGGAFSFKDSLLHEHFYYRLVSSFVKYMCVCLFFTLCINLWLAFKFIILFYCLLLNPYSNYLYFGHYTLILKFPILFLYIFYFFAEAVFSTI